MKETKERFYPGQTKPPYIGKVRDVADIDNSDILIPETTDRVSAFDVVLDQPIPFKGAVLNLLSAYFFKATNDVVPNCLLDAPHPRFSIWRKGKPFKFEVIVRGYNAGSFARDYTSKGIPNPWGCKVPQDIKENQQFEKPLVTPTTKAEKGAHDEPISRKEIIARKYATEREYNKIYMSALRLFARGQKMADKRGLILVDTKYEFARHNGDIILIDEVHTPDSSRYWYKAGYEGRLIRNEPQKQLSKELLREWLMAQGFSGKEGQTPPILSEEIITEMSHLYLELYKTLTGEALTTTIRKKHWPENWHKDEEAAYRMVCNSINKHTSPKKNK